MSDLSPLGPLSAPRTVPTGSAPPARKPEAAPEPPRDQVTVQVPARRSAPRATAPRSGPDGAPAVSGQAPAAPLAAPRPPATLLAEEPAPAAAPVLRGLDRGAMDPSVPASRDFFHHAVGGYLKTHPIPGDRPSFGVDAEIQEGTRRNLHAILEELAPRRDLPAGSIEQQLADFYASAMDEDALEARGAAPLQPGLDRIARIRDLQGLQDEVARLHREGVPAFFSFYASQDARNSQQMIGELFQGGLGLPERDYYLSSEPDARRVLGAYRGHVEKMFGLLGQDPDRARASAQAVLEVETALAAVSKARVDLRDPEALYNRKDKAALAAMTPHLDWPGYFRALGLPDAGEQATREPVNVATPEFFQGLDAALTALPLEDLKTYLAWKVLDGMAPHLSSPFAREDFEFHGRTLQGLERQPDRWKRVVALTDECLGEALGQKYVERHFPPEAKARVQEMVEDTLDALRDKVRNLSWMDEPTKAAAQEKIDTFTAKIGYPDRWTRYDFEVRRDDLAGNVQRAREFAVRDSLAQIGHPVDRTRWYMSPPTVNAYYSPTTNEIVFPAGILQPPYFDVAADPALNFGGIGATIGHELSHGFDDEGARFDKNGNLVDWWSAESLARFQKRAEGTVQQYGEFSFEGIPVNGKLVAGEALADLGGLELAHAALARHRARRPSACDDGFTSDQRFFLSYALSWATNMRPEYAKLILQTDPHPLPEFRVNGPLANMPAFHQAFGLQPGDPMVRPEERRNALWD